MVGVTGFGFNCLGTSSLSSIFEVLTSSCRLMSIGDRTDSSTLGLDLEIKEGDFSGSSPTTNCSHSSAMEALVSFSFRSCFEVSSSTTMTSAGAVDCGILSENLGWLEIGSGVALIRLGGTDLYRM